MMNSIFYRKLIVSSIGKLETDQVPLRKSSLKIKIKLILFFIAQIARQSVQAIDC